MGSDPLKSHIRDWQEMAAVDPLRAVSGQSKLWSAEDFFATAKPHMDQLFSVASALGLPKRFDRALEFGCGAGRFLRHLGKHFKEVWGVDVSQHMIDLASKHSPESKFYVNATNDLGVFANQHFDLVYSFLVLQHLPNEAVIAQYISEFMRVLKPDGLAAFQVPDRLGMRWKIQPRRRVYSLLRTLGFRSELLQSWNLLPMRFTAVARDSILSVVSTAGGRIIRTEALGQPEGLMYYCTKSPSNCAGYHGSTQ